MAELKPYQQRVVEEFDALMVKLNALKKYLETNENELLTMQRNAMTEYAFVLSVRIDEFNQPTNTNNT